MTFQKSTAKTEGHQMKWELSNLRRFWTKPNNPRAKPGYPFGGISVLCATSLGILQLGK